MRIRIDVDTEQSIHHDDYAELLRATFTVDNGDRIIWQQIIPRNIFKADIDRIFELAKIALIKEMEKKKS